MTHRQQALDVLRYAQATKPLDFIQSQVLERDVLVDRNSLWALPNVMLQQEDSTEHDFWAVVSEPVKPTAPLFPPACLRAQAVVVQQLRSSQQEMLAEGEEHILELAEWVVQRNKPLSFIQHQHTFELALLGLDSIMVSLLNQSSSLDSEVLREWKHYIKLVKAWREEWLLFEQGQQVYQKVFDVYNQLKMDGGADLYEIVWGFGMIRWAHGGTFISHPLVVQPCEILLTDDHRLCIKPAQAGPELQYSQLALPRHGLLEDRFAQIVQHHEIGPYEETKDNHIGPSWILELAQMVDSKAYWALHEDRSSWPSHPEISPNWCVFIRKRPQNRLMDDIKAWEQLLQHEQTQLPLSIINLLDPSTLEKTTPPSRRLVYRGAEQTYFDETPTSLDGDEQTVIQELYFPLPYNEEQLHIIKKLDEHNACVVQGPPGTGKTHSIANIICHYLAQGKRVLVTASTTQTLEVIRDKIPEKIRDLSATLLSSDTLSIRDFEKSVEHISQKLSLLDDERENVRIQALSTMLHDWHKQAQLLDEKIFQALSKQGGVLNVLGETWSVSQALQTFHSYRYDDMGLCIQDVVGGVNSSSPTIDDLEKISQQALTIFSSLKEDEVRLYFQYGAESKQIFHQNGVAFSLPDASTHQAYHDKLRVIETFQQEKDDFCPQVAHSKRVELLHLIKATMQELDGLSGVDAYMEQALSLVLSQRYDSVLSFLKKVKAYEKLFTPLQGRVVFHEELLTSEVIASIRGKAQQRFFNLKGLFSGNDTFKQFCQTLRLDGEEVTSSKQWQIVDKRVQQVGEVRMIAKIWNGLCDQTPSLRLKKCDYETLMAHIVQYATLMQQVLDKQQLMQRQRGLVKELMGEHYLYMDLSYEDIERWDVRLRHEQEKMRLTRECEQLCSFWESWGASKLREEGRKAWNGDPGQWQQFTYAHGKIVEHQHTFSELDNIFTTLENWGGGNIRQVWEKHTCHTFWEQLPKMWQHLCLAQQIEQLPKQDHFNELQLQREELSARMQTLYENIVGTKAWKELALNTKQETKQALASYLSAVRKIGKSSKGVRGARFRALAKESMTKAYQAIPCWIMPEGRVFENMPAELGLFDLVIVDEASQSTITMFPALLRGKKILVVGDDRQVSPSVAGLSEKHIQEEHERYLSDIPLGKYMTRDHSLYELFSIGFSQTSVMLREHFRSHTDIISYSNKRFYHNHIIPLKVPKGEERKVIPLIDCYVSDGVRENDVNVKEAQTIVKMMIDGILSGEYKGKTLGVVTLASDPKQAALIRRMLDQQLHEKIPLEEQLGHKITIGVPAVFQGSERDIMFVGMGWSKDTRGVGGREFEQRVNVAMTRAKQQMILVHSLHHSDAKPGGILQSILSHFGQVRELEEHTITRQDALGWERVWQWMSDRHIAMFAPPKHLGVDLILEKENKRVGVMFWGYPISNQQDIAIRIKRERLLKRAGWDIIHLFASDELLQPQRFFRAITEDLLRLELLSLEEQTPYDDMSTFPDTTFKKESEADTFDSSRDNQGGGKKTAMLVDAFEARMDIFQKALQKPKTLLEMIKDCDSVFEEEILSSLYSKYHLVSQVSDYGYRMDLVAFDHLGKHLVIECDGDKFHTDTKKDDIRQRFLERRGWVFTRVWGSDYFRNKTRVLKKIMDAIEQAGVQRKQQF